MMLRIFKRKKMNQKKKIIKYVSKRENVVVIYRIPTKDICLSGKDLNMVCECVWFAAGA